MQPPPANETTPPSAIPGTTTPGSTTMQDDPALPREPLEPEEPMPGTTAPGEGGSAGGGTSSEVIDGDTDEIEPAPGAPATAN
ncbi:hypothetical protein ACFQ4K_18515 [Tistrella bauzanensis]